MQAMKAWSRIVVLRADVLERESGEDEKSFFFTKKISPVEAWKVRLPLSYCRK